MPIAVGLAKLWSDMDFACVVRARHRTSISIWLRPIVVNSDGSEPPTTKCSEILSVRGDSDKLNWAALVSQLIGLRD